MVFGFVEFSERSNGFKRAAATCNTTASLSFEFRNVLVQANILDAMGDKHCFTKIIERYAQLDERFVVFVDVNSKIIGVDSDSGKDMSSVPLAPCLNSPPFHQLRPSPLNGILALP